jgi:hypothetical protein
LLASYVQQAIAAGQTAQEVLDAILAAGLSEGVFPSLAAGESGTTDGQYFWVGDAGTVVLYRNDAGVGTEIAELATAAGLAGKVDTAALASSSGGDMVRYKQTVSGSVSRTAASKFAETVSLQDFGATGDGATDDTASVQAAFDSGVGAIFVPRGTYIVSTVTGSNLYLYGPGTFKKKAATKGVMLNLTGDNRIEGVTLDYNWQNADSSSPYVDNLTVQQVQGSLDLAGVKFINSYAAAVYNVGANLGIDSACSFTGGAPHNGLTSGSERPTYYVFCIADEDTENQVISIGGAYFEGSSLDPTELHLNPTGIFITASAIDGYRFKAINISNPTLLGCSTNAGNGNVTGAIDLYNGADNIVISGATIRYFTYAGVKVQNSSYFSVTGNTITDGSVPAGAVSAQAQGIIATEKNRGSAVEQKFAAIANNILSGCTYAGINNSCDYVVISGNQIEGVALSGGNGTGILSAGNFVNIVGNAGTDILGQLVTTSGDHVKVQHNNLNSGSGAAAGAMLFDGNDVDISHNSFASGSASGGSGIRTNGPASNVRIAWNYVDNFPYIADLRTDSGAVDTVMIGPNQGAWAFNDYNFGGVTNKYAVSTAAIP